LSIFVVLYILNNNIKNYKMFNVYMQVPLKYLESIVECSDLFQIKDCTYIFSRVFSKLF